MQFCTLIHYRRIIYGMAPSSLVATMAQTKTPGDLVVFGEYGFLSGASMQDLIGNGLY
jgi:hypothetical protein